MHPAMSLRGVQARFIDPDTGQRVALQSEVYTIADYVNAAIDTGLRIDRLEEHAVDEAVAAAFPRGARYLGWPILLALSLRR